MKTACMPLLVTLIVLMAVSAPAQPPCRSGPDRNLILTEGSAEVTGQNDSARVSVAVVTEARSLEQVTSQNARKTKKVIRAIRDLNVRGLKFQTVNYRVTPQKDYKVKPPKIKGYEVYNEVKITVEGFEPEDLSEHISNIIGSALASGANDVRQAHFYIKDKGALEKEVLTLATQEALDRARTLAGAAGVKLKRIASLSTRPFQEPPRPVMFRTAEMKVSADAAAPPMEIGESLIRVQVTLAYEIE